MPEPWPPHRRLLPVPWVLGLMMLFLFGAGSTPAQAHRMLVFAYAEGDTVKVESKFVPDTPVRQGKVMVLDHKTGQELLTGQTDDNGKFSFKIPAAAIAQKMDLKIVVDAALGHRGEWLLKADSYLRGANRVAAPSPDAPPVQAPTPAPAAPGAKALNLDQQALEAALQKTLERQLAPIKEMLTELTIHRTSLTDVIGGLGYILGIFGLWAYFASKKRQGS
jgi:nickel transport protein